MNIQLSAQCHQIIYPLDRYANLHLENNQLKYQLIHIESHKLSLEFRIILLKQEGWSSHECTLLMGLEFWKYIQQS